MSKTDPNSKLVNFVEMSVVTGNDFAASYPKNQTEGLGVTDHHMASFRNDSANILANIIEISANVKSLLELVYSAKGRYTSKLFKAFNTAVEELSSKPTTELQKYIKKELSSNTSSSSSHSNSSHSNSSNSSNYTGSSSSSSSVRSVSPVKTPVVKKKNVVRKNPQIRVRLRK
jgi:hypothetical protein